MERDPFERTRGAATLAVTSSATTATSRLRRSAIRRRTTSRRSTIRPRSAATCATENGASVADTPEHDWEHAKGWSPAFRPAFGTQGEPVTAFDLMAATADGRSHTQPLIDEGPAALPVVYALDAGAFDVIVSGDHLRTWGIGPAELQDAAMGNLLRWSASAPWTDEISGERRLVSSDTGDGWDAARILLPDVVDHLTRELGPHGRILIGFAERHLLVAGSLRPNDDEFAALFADFVLETSGGADEPVDRRVFELADGRLVEFAGIAAH